MTRYLYEVVGQHVPVYEPEPLQFPFEGQTQRVEAHEPQRTKAREGGGVFFRHEVERERAASKTPAVNPQEARRG